jgi:carboxymethylenebutenolidase
VLLRAADGNVLRAFEARPSAAGSRTGVLVLPDVRGLNGFYEELALRFGEAGVHALAIDYFGRTAGTDPRADDFDYMPHVERTTWAGMQADIQAASDHLRARGAPAVVTVGFCYGGRVSFLCATLPSVNAAGVVGFYGKPVGPGRAGTPAPADLAATFQSPVLGLFGGADPSIPRDAVDTFRAALDDAAVDHDIVVYPGAPHSFFDRKQEQYAAESADAWQRSLAFIRRAGGA